MPVEDLDLIRHLVYSSQPGPSAIAWREGDAGSWLADVHGVRLSLFHTHHAGASGLCLKLSGPSGRTALIEEPQPASALSGRYRSSGDLLLAEAIQALADLVSAQCDSAAAPRIVPPPLHREALFRLVLFGSA